MPEAHWQKPAGASGAGRRSQVLVLRSRGLFRRRRAGQLSGPYSSRRISAAVIAKTCTTTHLARLLARPPHQDPPQFCTTDAKYRCAVSGLAQTAISAFCHGIVNSLVVIFLIFRTRVS